MRWEGGRLGTPQTLLDDVPGGTNHDGSRLAFGPDGMLYMTTGDAGNARLAQDRSSLAGKILRLTPDGRPAPGNPFGDAVWTLGHRNPQGLVFHPGTGVLYATEHGPNTDDEVNLIERGRNYGWPDVRGYCDSGGERDFCAANEVVEPVEAWTPTVAVAGADFYDGDVFPEWRGSLLVTALRGESLFRLTLTSDGRRAASTERLLEGELGRIRDVLVGPDGTVYLATSNRDGRGRPRGGDDRIVRLTP
jgi:glucose/arabinose dehydrogenase